MVPAAGIAATADEAIADNGDFELLDSVTAVGNFEAAKSATFTTPNGETVTADSTSKFSYAASSDFSNMAIESVTCGDGTTVVDTTGDDFAYEIYAENASTGSPIDCVNATGAKTGTRATDLDQGLTPGAYYLIVKATGGDYFNTVNDYAELAVKFTVTAAPIEGAAIYNYGTSDVSDSTFVYNAASLAQNMGLAINGQNVDFNAGALNVNGEDYDLSVYVANSDRTVDLMTNGNRNEVWDAGKYVAVVKGVRGANAGQSVEIPFTVDAIDLGSASIVTKAISTTASGGLTPSTIIDTVIASINGADPSADLAAEMKATFVSGSNGSTPLYTPTGEGTYTYKIEASSAANAKNITNSANISFNVVGTVITDSPASANVPGFTYDGQAFSGYVQGHALPINLANRDSFDVDDIAVAVVGGSPAATLSYDDGDYAVTVTTAAGASATIDDINEKPGTYIVTASINSADLEDPYEYGGTASMWVKSTAATLTDSKNAFISYDGVTNDQFKETYTGEDFLKGVTVLVRDSKGNVIDPSNYKVTVTRDSDNAEVSEIVNVGDYTITVSSDVYDFVGNRNPSAAFEVEQAAITNVRMTNPQFNYQGIPYTGEAIIPQLQYTTTTDPIDEETEWIDVPAGLMKLEYTYSKTVSSSGALTGTPSNPKEMKEVGYYNIKVASLVGLVSNGNYALDSDFENNRGSLVTIATKANAVAGDYMPVIKVTDEKVFLDVPVSAWYADSVYKANAQDYMHGYEGTKLFGPNDQITRGQVACVLYNMAGAVDVIKDSDNYNEIEGWKTGFSDVDGHMYYAQAIAWAKSAGVVSGYAGTDKFGPEDKVTREQFACMLANYAQKVGNYEAVADVNAQLAKFADGSAVSGWAKGGVAWATASGIMGNGGAIDAAGLITRAETAAMAVNYQPVKISVIAPK